LHAGQALVKAHAVERRHGALGDPSAVFVGELSGCVLEPVDAQGQSRRTLV
jgi:hypothetical protein